MRTYKTKHEMRKNLVLYIAFAIFISSGVFNIGILYREGYFLSEEEVRSEEPVLSAELVLSEEPVAQTSYDWPGLPTEEVGHPLVQKGRNFVDHARDLLLANNNELLNEFLHIYQGRFDKTNLCGIRVNHAYSLFLTIKQLRPKAIIESGVNAGVSTYIMRMAAGDDTLIYALDPLDEPICGQNKRWIDPNPNTIYITGKENFKDLTEVNWNEILTQRNVNPKEVLVFLDDHLVMFDRLATLFKIGFSHVLVEDNYKHKEGATILDKAGFTPKQLFSRTDDNARFLFHNMISYKEFPPLVPPILAKANKIMRKKAGGFMVASDSNLDIVAPILRPDLDKDDLLLYEEICKKLDIDPSLEDNESYMQMMCYNSFAYFEILPFAPRLVKNWD